MTTKKNTAAKATTEAKQEAAASMGVKVTEAQLEKARAEGAIEAEKEAAKDAYRYATDGNLPSDSAGPKYVGMDEIMQYAPIIGLGIDEFKARIAENSDDPVPEEKVAGLLSLERSGQNRTDYVRALCDRLGVKSPYEVTNAGPGYTNDTSPITAL